MLSDLVILSPETVSSKLADCKDGETVTLNLSGKVMLHDGAIIVTVDPASVEKSDSDAPEPGYADTGAPDTGAISPGAAAIMGRKM